MKKFKIFDFGVSAVLLILFAFYFLFKKSSFDDKSIKVEVLFFCFFLGVWQCLSMIVHFFKWKVVTYKNIRLFYVIVTVITLAFSFLTEYRINDWPHAYFLPFTAIFYTCLCGYEIFINVKEPIDSKIKNSSTKILAISVFVGATAFTLSQYAKIIQHLLKIDYNWQFEFFMIMGMLVFQYLFIYEKKWELKLDYYFNMLLVSLMGSLLLWPLIMINWFYYCTDSINLIYFFAVVLLMFFEHRRRVAKLLLPVYISYAWVLYRFIILIFII
jgi:hypothetical protein